MAPGSSRTRDEQLLATDLHVEATYRLTEALVEAEARMRRRVELLSDVVFETDAAGTLVFLSRVWAELLGYPVADSIGRPLVEFVEPQDAPVVVARLQAPVADRPQLRMRRQDGVPLWVELSVASIPGGGAVGVLHDVTRQKQTQDELAKMSLVASSTDNMVIITDASGTVEWVNRAFEERTGYQLDDLRGQKPGHLLQGPESSPDTVAAIREAVQRGDSIRTELMNYTKARQPYWVQLQINPIRNGRGEIIQFISVQSDATDRHRAEEALRALNLELEQRVDARTAQLAQANRELESFAYSVSHDLRAPLRHIHGYLDMLRRTTEGQLSPKAQRYVQTVTDASVEMGQLIDDLLAFSRMGQAEMRQEPIDLQALVQEVVAGLETQLAGRTVQWSIAPLPPVLGDRAMVRQVLVNLLGNAVKYTGQRTTATIAVDQVGMEDGRVVFAVRDNGAGFDMAYADKLFGVFQRLHRTEDFEGTGIGLAIVRRIVQRHGGRVWAEAAVDRGATFYFTLTPAPHA